MPKASEIQTGNIIHFHKELVQVEEYMHRTPGNSRAFYQAKMRNIKTGKLVEYRFRPHEEVALVPVRTNEYQYLYEDGDALMVMDNHTYEQFPVPKSLLESTIKFLKEGVMITIALSDDDEPIMAQAPASVVLKVSYTEHAVKGDTATNVLKQATVETGATIRVPLFINIGDEVRIDTHTESYIERVKLG